MKNSGCQRRSRQRVGQVEKSTGLGHQESQTRVRSGATRTGNLFISRPTWFSCNLRNSELPKHRHTQGDSRAPGRRRQDDGADVAAFTEHGASTVRLAAARFQDTISRLPGMAGEANDATSAYQQEHMSEGPRLLRLPAKEPPRRRPKQWDEVEEPVVPLEGNLHGHP